MRQALEVEPHYIRLYIPSEITSPQGRGHMLPEHVYLLDRIRVVESDLMIVVADHTSFGIGGEVEMATALGKPIIFLSREETVSRFLIGTPANAVHALTPDRYFIPYRDWRDLKLELLPVLEEVREQLSQATHEPQIFRNVGKHVHRFRLARGLTVEELADKTGLGLAQLTLLEKPFEVIREELQAYDVGDLDLASLVLTPHQLEQLTHLGLAAIEKLANALDVSITDLIDHPSPKDPAHEVKQQLQQAEAVRLAALKARAHHFDITYREYESLKAEFVDAYIAAHGTKAVRDSRQHSISEKEFLDALHRLRSPGLR
jgi:transcriptional regulator with XRE-family HTH domain